MADVFISYSKKDRALAEMTDRALRASGFTTWWDDAIMPAEAWNARIVAEIEAASVVTVLWTPHALASAFVLDEAETGRRSGERVPVRFVDVEPPFGHGQIQTGDLMHWHGNAEDPRWQRVVEAVAVIHNGGGMRQELDWSSTRRFVAVASEDHSLSLWDLSTGEVRRLFGHTGPMQRVQFSPDGQRLASIGGGEAIIWHPETGDRTAAWQASGSAVDRPRGTFWAPDARMIATTSSNRLEIRRLVV